MGQDVTGLLNNITGFGTYQTLGNLSITVPGVADAAYTEYNRSLDLENGVHTTSWRTNVATTNSSPSSSSTLFQSTLFCSYPAQSCIYALTSDGSSPLPGPVTISLENQLMDSTLVNTTCDATAGFARLSGLTQADIGMKFDAVARVLGNFSNKNNSTTGTNASTRCSPDTPGLLIVDPSPEQTALALLFSAESNYDPTKGTAQYNYSFRSDEDPGTVVTQRIAAVAVSQNHSYESLLRDHTADYASWMGQFSLVLPDTANSSGLETSALVARYTNQSSDPFLEALLFDYSRHLLVSSSREGSLPPNLQGVWTESLVPAWDGSYVTDINLQMAHWGAEQTGLGDLSRPMFDFMANTWAPRGKETAQLLYNGSGWVAHAEMNTFGYTGMEEVAMWTNCECWPITISYRPDINTILICCKIRLRWPGLCSTFSTTTTTAAT